MTGNPDLSSQHGPCHRDPLLQVAFLPIQLDSANWSHLMIRFYADTSYRKFVLCRLLYHPLPLLQVHHTSAAAPVALVRKGYEKRKVQDYVLIGQSVRDCIALTCKSSSVVRRVDHHLNMLNCQQPTTHRTLPAEGSKTFLPSCRNWAIFPISLIRML
jgi:hypothetical protein